MAANANSKTPANEAGVFGSINRAHSGVGKKALASSSAARHRPHITIIGIQNKNGMLASIWLFRGQTTRQSWRALRQNLVIGKSA
jgi:hypothetical protein